MPKDHIEKPKSVDYCQLPNVAAAHIFTRIMNITVKFYNKRCKIRWKRLLLIADVILLPFPSSIIQSLGDVRIMAHGYKWCK